MTHGPTPKIRVVDGRRMYEARLTKGGVPACGWPRCRGTFGTVREYPGTDYRELILPAGWWPQADGEWEQTGYAAKRVRQGKPSKFRRPFTSAALMRTAVSSGADTSAIPAQPARVAKLPMVARCPRCRHLNYLDPGVLKIGTEDEYEALLRR